MYGDLVEVFSIAKAGTLPPYQSIAVGLSPATFNHVSVEGSRAVFTRLLALRSRAQEPDHGFGLNNPMPHGWNNECVFSYDGRYVTGLWDSDAESMEDGYYGGS
jgi:hypothetical protein